jgi:hypothetical protein
MVSTVSRHASSWISAMLLHGRGTYTNGSIVEIGEWDESADVNESSAIE